MKNCFCLLHWKWKIIITIIIEEIISFKYRCIIFLHPYPILQNLYSIAPSSSLYDHRSIWLSSTWFSRSPISAIYRATCFSKIGSICLRVASEIIWIVGMPPRGLLACLGRLGLSWRGSCSPWMSMDFCSLCPLTYALSINGFCPWRLSCLSLCLLLSEGS